MEQLRYEFEGGDTLSDKGGHALVGVVASGNLEVMIEPAPHSGRMHIVVNTAARGFGEIWQAVLADFHARHPMSGVLVSINDAGATPAVVSLRLDQAVEALRVSGT
ncbi:MAG TPA: malonate decarboxylase acyl carrier protein [Casimicrobiaceae bacterium]|nr:malonate decarboxylase acyl carrier protein [Casimicrobiaceae bacterium]